MKTVTINPETVTPANSNKTAGKDATSIDVKATAEANKAKADKAKADKAKADKAKADKAKADKAKADKAKADKAKAGKPKAPSLKSQVNNEWKIATRSMSGLVRYIQGDGKDSVQKFLDELNARKGSSINIGNLSTKNFVKWGKGHELKQKDGSDRQLFSLWFALTIAGRMAEAERLADNKAKALAKAADKGTGLK